METTLKMKDLKVSVKNLIKRTTINSTSENRNFRCQKYDSKVFVAAIGLDGRSQEWIEIIDYKEN